MRTCFEGWANVGGDVVRTDPCDRISRTARLLGASTLIGVSIVVNVAGIIN